MPDLAIIVPTRGRPGNIEKVISAWNFTNAWDRADLVLAVDSDDPEIEGYRKLIDPEACPMLMVEYPTWQPMVPKLNATARGLASQYFALGFAGDDHFPRTINWADKYLTVLREMGTGMVYGDDGYQGANLSTEWALTSDLITVLDRMVPADVEHMYSDTSLLELMRAAGIVRHLPGVQIEHMHPIVNKAPQDKQYQKVNSRDQFHRDRLTYLAWKRLTLPSQLAAVHTLVPEKPPVPTVRNDKMVNRSRRMVRSAPTSKRRRVKLEPQPRTAIAPREFRNVRGATPDEIGITLADLAAQVSADRSIVEVGVFQGRTALLMAWGAAQGHGAHVWGVDAWELADNTYAPPFKTVESRNAAAYNVKATGYHDRVTLVQGFSLETAEVWTGPPIGLLFIDGDHTRDGARSDVLAWARHLAPGAVIALDDYGHPDWPGVAQAVEELVTEGVLEPIQIFHDRLAVTRLVENWTALSISHTTPEGGFPETDSTHTPPVAEEPELTSDPSAEEFPALRCVVHQGELDGVAEGTPLENLNTYQLRSLAKVRGVKLGLRKDKRSEMLEALHDGK